MQWSTIVFLAIAVAATPAVCTSHPAQGIVVDSQGTVFFLDTGAGVWRLDTNGALSKVPGSAFHWLALDRAKQLSHVSLPIIPEGGAVLSRVDYDLILSSDFPIATDASGALYYPRLEKNQLRIFRFDSNGATSTFGSVNAGPTGKPVKWINGSTVGGDGTFYYTEDHGVWKIAPEQEPVAVYNELDDAAKSECSRARDIGFDLGATFRGIDIDSDNNLWVAATACRAVLKISPERKVTTVVKTNGAWSPTGIAAFGKSVYVLEHFHTASERRHEWIPRVRRIAGRRRYGRAVEAIGIRRGIKRIADHRSIYRLSFLGAECVSITFTGMSAIGPLIAGARFTILGGASLMMLICLSAMALITGIPRR